MYEENEFILSKDGLKLHIHNWSTENPEKVLCIIHGLGEHGARYHHMAEFLNSKSVEVFAFDLRGHGHSEGKKGHARSYSLLQSDIEELLKHARAQFPELPMILFGHSLGGNLVSNYVLNDTTKELSGYILSSPYFKVAFDPPAWKVKLGTAIGTIFPSMTQSTGLDPNAISRIPEEVAAYQNDTLIHSQISVRLYLDSTYYGNFALESDKEIKIPGLLYHGSSDRLTDFKSSEVFAKKQPKTKWVPIQNAFHETHYDLCRDEVYELLESFIKNI